VTRSLAPILNSKTPAKAAAAHRLALARLAAQESAEDELNARLDALVGSEPPC
jgi:hypothetical protein